MSIREHLNKIRNAIYGREVRESIAKGIETAYDDASENGNANMEVKMARGTNPNLNARLNKMDEVDRQTNNVIKNKVGGGTLGSIDDFDSSLIEAIQGTGASFSLLSVPKDKSVTPLKTTFINASYNMFNKDSLDFGVTLDPTTGEKKENLDNAVSQKMYVTPHDEYTIDTPYIGLVFYDQDENFIDSIVGISTAPHTFVVPENAVILKIFGSRVTIPQVMLNKGSESHPYEPYMEPRLDNKYIDFENFNISPKNTNFFKDSSNLFNKDNALIGKTLDPVSGEFLEHSGNYVSEKMYLKKNQNYTINQEWTRVMVFDKSDNVVFSESTGIAVPYTFKTLNDAEYIRIFGGRADLPYIMLNEGTQALPYEEFHYPQIMEKHLPKQVADMPKRKKINLPSSLFDVTGMPNMSTGDINGYSVADIYALYDDLVTNFPNYVTKEPIKGDNFLFRFKPEGVATSHTETNAPNEYPKFLITTGVHGHEKHAIWSTYYAMKQICEEWVNDEILEKLRFNIEFVIIPVVNPWGYTGHVRETENGVDILRNFPETFDKGSEDIDSPMYRGTAPLSEIETQAVYEVYQNESWSYVMDHHNFGSSPVNNYLWIPGTNTFTQKIAQTFIRKISNKWKKENPDIPKDAGTYLGYSNINDYGIYEVAAQDGVMSHLFETNYSVQWTTNSIQYDSESFNYGVESLINWFNFVHLNI